MIHAGSHNIELENPSYLTVNGTIFSLSLHNTDTD
jgi:hypothetical protein